ncbi:MAG TPA: hypothetical protein VGI47_11365 [Candidatus Binataceae bacterium]|jgi:outer membrane murein-binding lipoprotein Lpp
MTNHNRASNRVLIAAVALAGLMLSGCSGGPKDDAQNYINNLKLFNYRATYDELSHGDQLDRTIDQFLNNIPLAPDVDKDWFKYVLTHTDYALGEPKVDGNTAIVPLTVTAADLAVWERTIDTLPTAKSSSEAQAQDSLNAGSFPKVTYSDSMVMTKQPDGWKLVVNFPQKESVAKMHKTALDLYHKHDYDKAIATYTDLLAELDKSPATGNEGLKYLYGRELKEIQNVKAQMADAQAYIPKLALSDVDLKMSASRVPGIFGKITNSGDKALDEVQMTVNYYEGKGKKKKQVATEDHSAIATPFTFTNFARPVLPLAPGETRDFGFKLTAPVEVQQRATPDLVVSGVVFTQSSAPLPKPGAPAASAAATPAGAASPAAK